MAILNARKAQMASLAGDGYAKRYRQKAVVCRKQSESAKDDPSARSIFLRLAILYQGMANQFADGADAHRSRSLHTR